MEAAAAAPRPRLLLLVLAAAATLVPGTTGERRRGGAGGRLWGARAGPGLWLAPSLSQTWRGAGGAGGGSGPGPGWPGLAWRPPRERRAGSAGGAGACVRARVDVRSSRRRPLLPPLSGEVASGGAVRGPGCLLGSEGARTERQGVCGWPGLAELGRRVALFEHPTRSGRVPEAPGAGLGSRGASRAG